jgi:transposase
MKLIPVSYAEQILPGTFEHTLCGLVDEELNLSAFDERFKNDDNGAPAYDPRVLLKVVLFAYAKGITSSRRIAHACRQNVVFMALSGDSQPHFSTVAEFISGNHAAVLELFRRILLVCDEMGLIGEEMFAVDGMKLPSNASKAWSGTRADFQRKVEKLDGAIRHMMETHQRLDATESEADWVQREQQQIETLRKHLAKIQRWLEDHEDDRKGPSGQPVQSNLTDPDSAKMKTAKGVSRVTTPSRRWMPSTRSSSPPRSKAPPPSATCCCTWPRASPT